MNAVAKVSATAEGSAVADGPTHPPVHPLAATLDQGLDAIGLALPCTARDKLLAYVDLLVKWNSSLLNELNPSVATLACSKR